MGLFGRNPESKITQANVDILQKLDLIRHSLESARSALPLPECAELANDLKAELEVKFTSFFAILCIKAEDLILNQRSYPDSSRKFVNT